MAFVVQYSATDSFVIKPHRRRSRRRRRRRAV